METEAGSRENILSQWLLWQFLEMPKFLLQIWNNYFIFARNLFSFTLLLKTFFSPWRRYRWRYPRGFDLGEVLSTFISNVFSRIIGAMMRVVLIFAGILFQIFVAFAGALAIAAWLLVPFIVFAGFIFVIFL
jgi:hypothetical protein